MKTQSRNCDKIRQINGCEQAELQRLDEVKGKFIVGENISGIDFLKITKRDDFFISERTARTIRQHVLTLNSIGAICYKQIENESVPKLTGCRHYIINYYLSRCGKRSAEAEKQGFYPE